MLESQFQKHIIDRIKNEFEGAIVLKNDSSYIQGIPDLTIFYKDKWAMLEIKKDAKSSHRPNQEYYVSKVNDMSYGAFVYPENEEEIFDELRETFRP